MESHKPLLNKKIVITRPEGGAKSLARQVEKLGGISLKFPLLQIKYRTLTKEIATTIENLPTYDLLVFTSVNGIHAFFQLLSKESMAMLHKKKFAVIGNKTAKVLTEYGFKALIIPTTYTAEHLADAIIAETDENSTILLLSGNLSKPLLKKKLMHADHTVVDHVVYDTVKRTEVKREFLTFLQENEIDFITFTSGSAATTYLTLIKEINGAKANYKLACIGPITAQVFINENITPTVVADEYTSQGLLDKIVRYYKEVENESFNI